MATIELRAIDQSTYAFDIVCINDETEEQAPKSLKWTLTDGDGVVINGRLNVVIANPTARETVVLSGNDLIASEVCTKRIVLAQAVYDSNDLGDDLPINQEGHFFITDLVNV